MNTKGIKFLAVLAVLAMAFAAFAVITDVQQNDAEVKDTDVAKIGNTGYASLGAAIEAVTDGQEIILLKDIKEQEGLGIFNATTKLQIKYGGNTKDMALPVGKSFTLNLGGFTYEITKTAKGSSGTETQSMHIEKGCNVTFKNGTIEVPTGDKSVTRGANFYSNIVLEDITWNSTTTVASEVMKFISGTSEIKGKTSISSANGPAVELGWWPKPYGTFDSTLKINTTGTITGNVFTVVYYNDVSEIVAPGSEVNVNLTINDANVVGSIGVEDDVEAAKTIAKSLIKVNGGSYSDLTALPYVQSGKSITLKAENCEFGGTAEIKAGTTLVIDKGSVLTNTGSITVLGTLVNNGKIVNSGTLSVYKDDNTASGKITNNGTVESTTTINATNGTIDGSGTIASKATVSLTNGKFINGYNGVVKGQTIDGSACPDGTSLVWAPKEVSGNTFKIIDGQRGVMTYPGTNVKVIQNTFKSLGTNPARDAIYAEFGAADMTAQITGNTIEGEYKYGMTFTHGEGTYDIKIGTASSNNVVIDDTNPYMRFSADGFTVTGDLTVGKKLTIEEGIGFTIAADAKFTIGEGAKISVDKGTETIDVKGTLVYSDVTQIYDKATVSDKGEIKVAGEGGGSAEEEVVVNPTLPEGTKVIDQDIFDKIEKDEEKKVDVVVTDAAITGAVIPEGKTLVINNTTSLDKDSTIDVSKTESYATVNATTAATFNVTTETGKKVALADITGTLTFYKGSIVVEAKEWSGGSITLNDGDVLKLSGDVKVSGTVTIDVAGSGSAKMIIEADKKLEIGKGATLTIAKGITVEISGTVAGEGTIDASAANAVTIKSGAVVESTTLSVNSAKTNVVYSGSDINTAVINGEHWTGKDAASGTWTFKSKVLTLDNYNGTYNFGATTFDDLVKIELVGENKITYALPETFAAKDVLFQFKSVKDTTNAVITTDSIGTLEISVDISKIKKDNIATELAIICDTGNKAAMKINGVGISIVVKGSNPEWGEDVSKFKIAGIVAYSLELFKAPIGIEIMDSVEAVGIMGIVTTTGGISATSDSDMYVEAYIPVYTKDVAIMASDVEFVGKSGIDGLTITNESSVYFNGYVYIDGAIAVSQNSKLELDDADLTTEATVSNKGFIGINGNVVINAAFTNDETLDNDGVLGIYNGAFTNNGTFINDGTFTVYGKKFIANGESVDLTITDDSSYYSTIGSKILLNTIDITEIIPNADGSADIKATVKFIGSDGKEWKAYKDVKLLNFEGKLVPSQTKDDYTLSLSTSTASITVTYTKATTADTHVGGEFGVSVSGGIMGAEDSLVYIENNQAKSGKTIAGAAVESSIPANSWTAATGSFIANKGTVTNNASFTLYIAGDIVAKTGVFNGPISLYAVAAIAGTFSGEITSTANVTSSGSIIGDIVTDGDVLSTGTIVGDITSKGSVTVKTFTGDITMKTGGKDLTVTGKANGTVTYLSEYKKDKSDTTKTTATNKLELSTDLDKVSVVIGMKAGVDADSTSAGKAGYFVFSGAPVALGKDKTAEIKVTEGKFGVDTKVDLKSGYALVIESGVMIEVARTATLDASEAALKVSKDAVRNYEVGPDAAKTYGKVLSIMMFDTADSYTIYSDVAYALSNCDEGAELTVNSNADIASNVSVKKGVNVIVADKVTVDFKDNGVAMDNDAKITLLGTGKIKFGATGEKTEKGKAWEFYAVSGTIVYDGNTVVLDKVRFTDAGVEFAGVAATSTAASKINAKMTYFQGEATISAGYAAGAIVLLNKEYKLTEDAVNDAKFSGELVIAEGAVCDASITDVKATAEWDDKKGELNVTKKPSLVTVNGTLNAAKDMAVNGMYIGTGKIVLSPNVTLTINGGEYTYDSSATPKRQDFYGPSFTGTVVDTTDATHEHSFLLVFAKPEDDNGTDPKVDAVPLKIKALKTSSVEYITLEGAIKVGAIAADSVELNGLVVDESSSVTGNVVEILKDSDAIGSVIAKELKQKSETESKLGELDYTATYPFGEYTVYTLFENIDFDIVTDVTLTESKTLKELYPTKTKLDLSGSDVNITVAEGKTLTVDMILIIGTPIYSLGADEGSSIVGKVIIKNDADSYIIAYADVDLTQAVIVQKDKDGDAAVYSVLDIDEVPYATIFACDGLVKLSDADKRIIPYIEGYNFTQWVNYGPADSTVGDTNAYADFKAVFVTVMVKYVEGVDYYMNGLLFTVYDIPTDVSYGSYFTAKISDTTKYQGNPLINGEKTVCVTDDVELVASGVTPIPEPPQPEPEPVVGDSGLSLTDILLIVLVVLIAIMVVILVLRLNRS